VLRHELAHCNGWPADHKGARKVFVDSVKNMPTLPADAQVLPAYPPVMCLTPEWAMEDCAERETPLPRRRPMTAPVLPAELGTYWESKTYWPQLDRTDYEFLSHVSKLPPREYDHPFDGRLRVVELGNKEEVFRVCQVAWQAAGPRTTAERAMPTK
jgi:hypothetical protein